MSVTDQPRDADFKAAQADYEAGRLEEFRNDMRAESDAERVDAGTTEQQILWDRRNQVRDEVARVFQERDALSWPDAAAIGDAYADSVSDEYLRKPWSDQRLNEAVTVAGQLENPKQAAEGPTAQSAVARLRGLVARVQAVNSAPTTAVAAGTVEASRVLVEQARTAVAPAAERSPTRATPSWGASAEAQPQRQVGHGR